MEIQLSNLLRSVLLLGMVLYFIASHSVHAVTIYKYKAVMPVDFGQIEKVLNENSADGWEFVASAGAAPVLIFRK
jgi:hypothetical protein